MSYADGLLSTGERISYRNKQHPFVFIWGARYTILALVIAARPVLVRQRSRHATARAGSLATLLGWVDRGPVLRRHRRRRLDGPALHQPGVRADQPPGHPGRRRPQQELDRQLAREDQRRRPDPVRLRADVRLRRPDRPDRVRSRHRQDAHAAQADRVQEGDARREARVRGRHGALRLAARTADPRRRARADGRLAATTAAAARQPAPHRPRRLHPASDPDEVTRTLANLADLRDRGAITPEEYEHKKADLLSRL